MKSLLRYLSAALAFAWPQLALAAEAAGHDFQWVCERIVEEAQQRWLEGDTTSELRLASTSALDDHGAGRHLHAG